MDRNESAIRAADLKGWRRRAFAGGAEAVATQSIEGCLHNLFGATRAYLSLGERLIEALMAASDGGKEPLVGKARSRAGTGEPVNTTGPASGGLSALPWEHWGEVVRGTFELPRILEDLASLPGADAAAVYLRSLSAPTRAGDFRDDLEPFQDLNRSWSDFQNAERAFASLLSERVGGAAGELMSESLVHLAAAGRAPTTFRALYDLWVDCGERVYGEIAGSAEFASARAKMLNALIAFKRQQQLTLQKGLSAPRRPDAWDAVKPAGEILKNG